MRDFLYWLLFAVIILAFGIYLWQWSANNEEDKGNALEKQNLIQVESPRPNSEIGSPLTIKGKARGTWYFEASFPLRLIDASGENIPLDPPYITAKSDWMTEDFVPFETTHAFATPKTKTGTIILIKDNPSGLPENEDELRIPVAFSF